MKKLLSLVLVLALVLSSSAFALNYTNKLGNEATFETLEEAREGAAAGSRAGSNPCLDAYPAGTTFVYRSANLWGVSAAVRMNTNILVYTDAKFETKDAAKAYLADLGLIDIIDKAIGAVVLVTPAGKAFAAADARAYYLLQTAMSNSSYGEYNYMGAFNWRYVIGIDGGATFINDYVAPTLDFVGRNAGMLLINGSMNTELNDVATFVPVVLANAPAAVVEEYKAANGANAYVYDMGNEIFYNQEFPLRSVVVTAGDDYKALIDFAYNNLFIKAQRIPVLQRGANTFGTEFNGYGMDQAPFSLCARNAIVDGKTADGIYMFEHVEDRFIDIPALTGEYMQTWYEFLPEEVLDGTAGEHTVPLWLANHGGGDDPIQFVDEIGLLDLAGEERFAMVAPYYQSMYDGFFGGGADPVPLCQALCAIVKYMLETYPALDPSRVYVTGYSLGGGATFHAILEEPELFAAAIPMSAAGYEGTEEQIANFDVALPLLVTTSTYDLGGAFDTPNHHISLAYTNTINKYAAFAGIEPVEFDFETYPLSGFQGDIAKVQTLNGEYVNHSWFLAKDGAPFVGVAYTENLVHALYPEFGKLAWDWAKHFSRNQETLEIEYK